MSRLDGSDHADELLSAHLDGELDDASSARVEEHLAECEHCRTAAVDLAMARAALRSLPLVDSTPVVQGVLARHHALIRTGVVFVGVVSVVLGVLAVRSTVRHPVVAPDVGAMAAAHEADGEDMSEIMAIPGMRPTDEPGDGYAAPSGLIGSSVSLSRHAVYDGTDMTAVFYRDVDVAVSVFQQPGRLDWATLPDGDLAELGDRRVWVGTARPTVAVTEVGDLVVSAVSDDRAAVLTVLASLPDRRRSSTWDRVHDACERFIEVFTLEG